MDSDDIAITGTWVSDDEMPATEHKEDPVTAVPMARQILRPSMSEIGKTIVRLHGGMSVKYPHGWCINQECALMYSMVREVCTTSWSPR